MKANDNKKPIIQITDGNLKETADVLQDGAQSKLERLKKPLIFGFMGIAFLGCMYLLFKPASDDTNPYMQGLNDVVPQASEAGMQSDKQKAYEQDMLDQKNKEDRTILGSLSDHWNIESEEEKMEYIPDEDPYSYGSSSSKNNNASLNSYRNVQSTLGSFYQNENHEAEQLRKQLGELQQQLGTKDDTSIPSIDNQLQLMEKSYQIAAKYLPTNAGGANPFTNQDAKQETGKLPSTSQKENLIGFTSVRKSTVSTLYREPSDSAFIADWSKNKNRNFYTPGSTDEIIQPKNSIRACIQETQTIIGEGDVRLRLLEPAKTPNRTIPEGTILTANAKIQGGRLQLKITSVEIAGNIVPVELTIHDLDGQQGLYLPYSPEMNALSGIAGDMGQNTGSSNIMMTNSASQQIAADLSKGVIQGVSGYFSKKVKAQKATLKVGHQVFLVSKQ